MRIDRVSTPLKVAADCKKERVVLSIFTGEVGRENSLNTARRGADRQALATHCVDASSVATRLPLVALQCVALRDVALDVVAQAVGSWIADPTPTRQPGAGGGVGLGWGIEIVMGLGERGIGLKGQGRFRFTFRTPIHNFAKKARLQRIALQCGHEFLAAWKKCGETFKQRRRGWVGNWFDEAQHNSSAPLSSVVFALLPC